MLPIGDLLKIAKVGANAGIAGVALLLGGYWITHYLDREQVIRSQQQQAFMEQLNKLSSNISMLAIEMREARSSVCQTRVVPGQALKLFDVPAKPVAAKQ